MSKMNFSVDINWLCHSYIKREYEYMKKNQDKETNYIQYDCLGETVYKYEHADYDFKSDLDNFVLTNLKHEGAITLEPEVLEIFARNWLNNLMKSRWYLEEKKKRERKIYLRHRREEFNELQSAVWNKEKDEFVDAQFSEHWEVITEMIIEKFGKTAYFDESKHNEIDEWIKENIELVGQYYNKEKYLFRSYSKFR